MLNILFVCTHNRCRSILAEAISRHMGEGRIDAYSAGSQPSGVVHPDTLAHLARRGIDTTGLQSQSWDAYSDLSPHAVITVCDSAAGEQCPLWLGQTVKVHWGLPDPTQMAGSEAEKEDAFDAVINAIESRIARLLAMDVDNLAGEALGAALQSIDSEER